MKRILFPSTNRVHIARQKLLLNKLNECSELDIVEYNTKYSYILNNVADISNYFRKILGRNEYDLVLIRGDRYEMLPIAMLAAYKGIRIAHIEGGDLSGVIDNKVRYSITALSDIHFATNKESYARLIKMGTDPELTFDFGSLDVEYAKSIKLRGIKEEFVVLCHHPLPGEDPKIIERIIKDNYKGNIIIIKTNSDSGYSYGKEEYTPEDYIELIANAKCLVGNSSSFLKEASVFGTPVVNIGERQKNRLVPKNVISIPFDEVKIRDVLKIQLKSERIPSNIYYKKNTSKNIVKELLKYLEGLD